MDLRSERSWMYNRSSKGIYNIRYLEGVEEFIQFAKKKNSKEVRCPCKRCDNRRVRPPEVVRDHLLKKGFVENYYDWYLHKSFEVGPSNVMDQEEQQYNTVQNPYEQSVDAVASNFPDKHHHFLPQSDNVVADLLVDDFNDQYLEDVKNIKSQAPKKKASKAVYGLGDAAGHYYADFVLPKSQYQSAPPPQQMVNERLDRLQQVANNINDRLNNAISREEYKAFIEEQRRLREQVTQLHQFFRTLFDQYPGFQPPQPPPS